MASLLCSLRGHRVDPSKIVWNGGICFGACANCGTDLVRTIRDRWQVPRGYKVVWRAAPKDEPEPIAADRPGWLESELAEPVDWEAPEPALALEAEQETEVQSPEETRAQRAEDIAAPEKVEVEVAEPVEWPLSLQTSEADMEIYYPDALREPPVAAQEPTPESNALEDFMDDGSDDMNWDDFPDHRQIAAAG